MQQLCPLHQELISKKQVYISEEHHHVVLAWYKQFIVTGKALTLLSFDYHTDSHKAFLRYVFSNNPVYNNQTAFENCHEEQIQKLIVDTDLTQSNSVADAVSRLKHDEHI